MIFSKQMPVAAWLLILLLMNLLMAQTLEFVLLTEAKQHHLHLYHPEVLEIILSFMIVVLFVYFALYTERLYLLLILFALDSLHLVEKIELQGKYLPEQIALYIAFWMVPISLLITRRYDLVRKVKSKLARSG